MILYFDNCITNKNLGTVYHGLDRIRKTKSVYKFKNRFLVCLYSLISYSKLNFKFCIFKIKTSKNNFYEIKKLLRKHFSNYTIHNDQSDTEIKFNKVLQKIKKIKDNWIFVVNNLDHPFISSNPATLKKSLFLAKKFEKKFKFVSIMMSHQVEYLNSYKKELVRPNVVKFPYKKIFENKDNVVLKMQKNHQAHTLSIQIMNLQMFSNLIQSTDFKGNKIFRTDSMNGKELKNHIIIVPKEKLCDHFDGYSHLKHYGAYLPLRKYPPLFIPPNFFKKKIKIYFGYDKVYKNAVNINPSKKNYSFDDNIFGTDLKISLADLPYFWRERIEVIKIKKKANFELLNLYAQKLKSENLQPYPKKNFICIKIFLFFFEFKKNFYKNFPKIFKVAKKLYHLLKKIF
jgi:hypothetical protein